MEFPNPVQGQFTVYSKSGCINCVKVKNLLKENNINFTIIDCDNFILENKTEFLKFIQSLAGIEYKMFPIVFNNKQFIGGYNETNKLLNDIFALNMDF
jgi:glutaredoxin